MSLIFTNIGTANDTSIGPSVALSGVTVPADSLIIVVVSEYAVGIGATGGSLSDSVNGSYTSGTPIGNNNNPALYGFGNYFYFSNSVALSSASITYTKNTIGAKASISAFYVVGANLIDSAVTASTFGSSNSNPLFTLTSGTPSIANEAFVAIITDDAGNAWFGQDSGDGWGAPPNATSATGTFGSIAGGSQTNTGTGTKSFSPANSGLVTVNYASWILGFETAIKSSKIVSYSTASPQLAASKITSYATASPELPVSKLTSYAVLNPQLSLSKLVGYAILTPLTLTGLAATGQVGTMTVSIGVHQTGVYGTGEAGQPTATATSLYQPTIYIVT